MRIVCLCCMREYCIIMLCLHNSVQVRLCCLHEYRALHRPFRHPHLTITITISGAGGNCVRSGIKLPVASFVHPRVTGSSSIGSGTIYLPACVPYVCAHLLLPDSVVTVHFQDLYRNRFHLSSFAVE